MPETPVPETPAPEMSVAEGTPPRLPRTDAESIVDMLGLLEALKRELRHSWLSDGRQESVAEHCWMMAVAAILLAPRLEHPVDLGHVLKLIALHDLAEAITGDIPSFETSARQSTKLADETQAMATITARLPADLGAELHALWLEYEENQSPEARFARALDKLEVQQQHNLADLATWTPPEYGLVYSKMDRECAHDSSLVTLLSVIRARAEAKLAAGGIALDALRAPR